MHSNIIDYNNISVEEKPQYISDIIAEKIDKNRNENKSISSYTRKETDKFKNLCVAIKDYFNAQKTNEEELDIQKKAILGFQEQVHYYKDKIKEYLQENSMSNEEFPSWYSDLPSAIFHELYGLAGIAEWYEGKNKKGKNDELKYSPSAYIIGENIYFDKNGKTQLQSQKISKDRLDQLKRALLSNDYRVRMNDDVPDIEMITGERIKIFADSVTRKGKDTIIFRKFPVKDYTFEKQISLKTYPKESLSLLKALASVGVNTCFTGGLGSSKTTQLTTWLSYVDPKLIGLLIETRPEIPIDEILPNAPIVQLVLNSEKKLKYTRSSIMRSDADYVIMAEARDAYAYEIAKKSANVGAKLCKMTAHSNRPIDFPIEFATEITREFGGNVRDEAISVAKSYPLSLHFTKLSKNKSQKRLEGMYYYEFDENSYKIKIHTLIKYDFIDDSWKFNMDIPEGLVRTGIEENPDALKIIVSEFERLGSLYPLKEEDKKAKIPFYGRGY